MDDVFADTWTSTFKKEPFENVLFFNILAIH